MHLGNTVARAVNSTYLSYLDEALTGPLGMNSTGFPVASTNRAEARYGEFNLGWNTPAGGLESSPGGNTNGVIALCANLCACGWVSTHIVMLTLM